MFRSLKHLTVLLLALFVLSMLPARQAQAAASEQEYSIFSLERVALGFGANYERTFGDELELPDVVRREWLAGVYLTYNVLPGDEITGRGAFDLNFNVLRGFDSGQNRLSLGIRWTAFTGRHGS